MSGKSKTEDVFGGSGLGHENHLTKAGSWRNFRADEVSLSLRLEVCDGENIRFCSDLFFGDGYRGNPGGGGGGGGRRAEGEGKGETRTWKGREC